MNVRSPLSRAWIVMGLLGLALAAPLGIERVSASSSGPGVAVIGDSITARYNNDSGSQGQGWWSFVAKRYGVRMETFAESGSGYQRPGNHCGGMTFGERLKDVVAVKPRIVFIEGGRNDWAHCVGDRLVVSSDAEVSTGVDAFLTRLQNALPASTVYYVLGPPWGPIDTGQRDRVTRIIEASAIAHAMTFISTAGTLNDDDVLDGTHPNRAGSIAIARAVTEAIGPRLS